jgi:hypothetical protein
MCTITFHLEKVGIACGGNPEWGTRTFLFLHVSHEKALLFGWRLTTDDDIFRVAGAARDLQ